jgi:hypothetical protein
VLTGAATQLGGMMNQFGDLTHQNFAVPIDSLGMDVRALAGQIYAATTQLNRLLDRQRQCLFLNLDLFVSGVATVTANLKSGIPLVHPGDPFLTAFRFDSRNTANIVPFEGGRFSVYGFHVWTSKAPTVKLWNADRNKVLVELSPQRAASADSISLTVTPDLVKGAAGKCLQLQTVIRESQSFLGVIPRADKLTNRFLPMCVPQAFTEQVKIKAYIAYSTAVRTTQVLGPEQDFRFDSCACHPTHVQQSHGWPVPAGWSIVNLQQRPGERRNTQDTHLDFGWNGNIVTQQGTMDGGSCAPLRGCYLSAIFSTLVQPVIAGDVATEQTAGAESAAIPVRLPETQECLDIPKTGTSPRNTFWFTVGNVKRGTDAPPFYASPRITTNQNAASLAPAGVSPPFQIDATFNPQPVNGKAQVCVKLTNTQQCGY